MSKILIAIIARHCSFSRHEWSNAAFLRKNIFRKYISRTYMTSNVSGTGEKHGERM